MTEFGDVDPEDAYDAGDLIEERLAVLHRVVDDLEAEAGGDVRRGYRIADALRLLGGIARHRREVARLRERLEAL